MADPQPSCCICDPSDSALSTTANIISLITFVYVLLIGLLYQVALHQGSKGSIEGLREDVRDLRRRLNDLRAMYEFQQTDSANVQLNGLVGILEIVSQELGSVERNINRTFPATAEANGEKWYVVWTQMNNARKRAVLQRKVRTVDERVQSCVAAG